MSAAGDMGLSAAQAAAVEDARPQVLVAAAAGSGKTRLLVASVVRALLKEQLPIERLVAVTFTRKAGAELTSRVREALEVCGRLDLARSLDAACVGTIDSLCRRLVKDQALTLGLDPACAVLEAETAELVKKEVIDQTWEAVVQQADEAGLEVLASQGKGLCDDVVALYDRLRGLGQDEPALLVPAGVSEASARQRLVQAIEQALAAATRVKQSVSLTGDLSKVRTCLDWLEGPETERVGEGALRVSSGLFPSRKTPSLEQRFAPVRAALTGYRCALAEAQLRPLLKVVNGMLAEFHRRYTARKAEHGSVDFADLELKARALVDARRQGQRAEGPLRGSFLLVDEFQDTNELQCSILAGLGADRVLMVGDERQSIYRFRGADVEVFKRRRAALTTGSGAGHGGEDAGGLHRLDVNYRSTPEILDFINALFSHESFFGGEFARLDPDPDRAAVRPTGADAADVGSAPAPRVEVLVADRRREDEGEGRLVSMQQAEAEALAAHVRGMLDGEGWQQRDVVVLLPTQTQVEQYRDALAAQGVDVYLVRGKGYYAQEEVTDVTSLLRLLLNPRDDLALITVLRSPLVGMSDDALYLLGSERNTKRAKSLWEVVGGAEVPSLGDADRAALALFLARLAQLRPRVGRPGLARLIDDAVSAFSYDLCLLAAPEGKRRFANVRKLMRLAEDFEAATGPDLAAFLSVVKSTGQVRDREGSAPTLGEGEDVVRVMTVHQAKGLEFPVVFLAGLGSDSHRPESSTFALGSDGRVGVFLKGYRNQTYETHDLCCGPAVEIASEEARREQEEDVRMLYVAMTRAQGRLVLVGARPTSDSLEKTRIGRIVQALGLSAFPGSGEVAALPGLSAVVAGVATPDGSAAAEGKGAGQAAALSPALEPAAKTPAAHQADIPPGFSESPSVSGSVARVSFSALAAYQRCPRRFYLERVLGLSLEPQSRAGEEGGSDSLREAVLDDDEEHAGREVGILVHRLLERLAVSSQPPAVDAVHQAAEEALGAMGVRLPAWEVERAVGLTLAVWDSPVGSRLSLASALREAPFLFSADGILVSGVMDLLCREADCWLVVDYKTNALRGRPLAEVAEGYALQGTVYGLAALRAGAPAVQMDLLFLEAPGEPVTVRHETKDVAHLERKLLEAFGGIRQGRFPRVEDEDCTYCPVVRVCAGMVAA